MGIKFSPGCECCGGNYLCICRGVNLPVSPGGIGNGKGYYTNFSINWNGNVAIVDGAFIDPQVNAVLSTNGVLTFDAAGFNALDPPNFTNNGIPNLPLDPNTVPPQVNGQIIPQQFIQFPATVKFFAQLSIPLQGTFIFNFMKVSGSHPNWVIEQNAGSGLVVSQNSVAEKDYGIDANGNIF